jgi:hypothetical protein
MAIVHFGVRASMLCALVLSPGCGRTEGPTRTVQTDLVPSTGAPGSDAGSDGGRSAAANPGRVFAADVMDAGLAGPCTAVGPEGARPDPSHPLSARELAEGILGVSAKVPSIAAPSDPQAAAESIRAAVRNAPHVADTAIAQDCTVLVRLSDGTPISIADDSRPDWAGAADGGGTVPQPMRGRTAPAGRPRSGRRPPAPAIAPALASMQHDWVLPASREVYLGQISGFAEDEIPVVRAAFERRGYHVSPPAVSPLPSNFGMTPAELRTNIKNIAVLALSTHRISDCGTKEEEKKEGLKHNCLATNELRQSDLENCKAANDFEGCPFSKEDIEDVRQNRAVFLETTSNKAYYAINENWILYYWSFAHDALVFLDACHSLDDITLRFRTALIEKNAANLLGWRNSVNSVFAARTATHFFDRVLGGNKDDLKPPQRPFSFAEVYAAMQASGMTQEPPNPAKNDPGATLIFENHEPLDVATGRQADGILVPSIRNLTIGDPSVPLVQRITEGESATDLTLDGEFGKEEGQVEIGCPDPPACTEGTPLKVSSWKSDRIVVSIPSTGPGSRGFVQIKAPAGERKITSNAVPLTSWVGPMAARVSWVVVGSPPPPAELVCDRVHFRADIHAFRLEPDGPLAEGPVSDDGSVTPVVIIKGPVSDTTCQGTVGGVHVSSPVSTDWDGHTLTLPWRPASPPEPQPKKPTWWYSVSGTYDPTGPTFKLNETSVLFTSVTVHYPPPMGDQTATQGLSTATATLSPGSGKPAPPLPVDLMTYELTGSPPPFLDYVGNRCQFNYDLKAEPASTPSDDTEG